MGKKLILKDDFVIPKGTEFELIPSNTVRKLMVKGIMRLLLQRVKILLWM